MPLDEFSLIREYFVRPGARADVVLGIGDDAALLLPPPGQELAITTDTLLEGVHFPADLGPDDLGWRALAVNLSDLAAMGAEPAWATLALSLPAPQAAWLERFAAGFFELADSCGLALVGGDTVRGPLSITVQAIGHVPAGAAMRRAGARTGDVVAVTGTLGLAAAALRLRDGGSPPGFVARRLTRPQPRLAEGRALRAMASACIDVSDGLAADLGHVLAASDCGATLDAALVPGPPDLPGLGDGPLDLALHGGDDYELCFCCPPQAWPALAATPGLESCTRIGVVEASPGLRLREADGQVRDLEPRGYRHF